MIELNDARLLRQQAFIGGEWRDADDGGTIDVTDKATGETVGTVPAMAIAETRAAIEAAHAALPAWAALTAKERARILRGWFELIIENKDDLGRLITAEQGKPLAEAVGEITYAASFIEWFAEEGKRVYGDVIPAPAANQRIVVIKQPVGVCAAITPWNFPAAMITRKAGAALAAGCTMVIKPAELTPFTALALCALAERAGVPKGVIACVTGHSKPIGAEMTSNPKVRKITFTGSTPVGRLLMEQSAATIKKIALELGGNAPFIVFDDADQEEAIKGLIASKFRNAGQTCVCANRILVQDAIYDGFAEKFARAAEALKVAPGTEDGARIGPLINEAGVAKVEEHVADAVHGGAQVLTGGHRHELGGTFFEPTVLTDVLPEMRVAKEETFGPVAPLIRFKDEADAIRIANDSTAGLAAYFYGRDIGRVWRVAEALEYGMVGINEGVISTEVAPFGGVKESGLGREGSKYGIEEYVEIKYLCFGGLDR